MKNQKVRKTILQKINCLLDVCETCPKNSSTVSPQIKCAGCSIYEDMKELGKRLEKGDYKMTLEMSVEEYKKLKNDGLTDKQIAEKKGVSKTHINSWKMKHGVRAGDFTDVQANKQNEVKSNSVTYDNLRMRYKKIQDDYKNLTEANSRLLKENEDLRVKAVEIGNDRIAQLSEIEGLKKQLNSNKNEFENISSQISSRDAIIKALKLLVYEQLKCEFGETT